MKRLLFIYLTLMMLCVIEISSFTQVNTIGSVAEAATEDRMAKLNKLMDLSGIREQYNEIPRVIKSAADMPAEPGQELPEFLLNGIRNAVDRTIIAEDLINAVMGELNKNLTDQDLDMLLTWYQTEAAQNITAAENAAAAQAEAGVMEADWQNLMNNPKRVATARKVDDLTQASEFAMDIQMFTQLAMISAIADAMGPESGINIELIRAQMEQARPMLLDQSRQMSVSTFVFTYRELDDSTVDQYVKFLESPESQKFVGNVMAATKVKMEAMITAFTKEMVTVLRQGQEMAQ